MKVTAIGRGKAYGQRSSPCLNLNLECLGLVDRLSEARCLFTTVTRVAAHHEATNKENMQPVYTHGTGSYTKLTYWCLNTFPAYSFTESVLLVTTEQSLSPIRPDT